MKDSAIQSPTSPALTVSVIEDYLARAAIKAAAKGFHDDAVIALGLASRDLRKMAEAKR